MRTTFGNAFIISATFYWLKQGTGPAWFQEWGKRQNELHRICGLLKIFWKSITTYLLPFWFTPLVLQEYTFPWFLQRGAWKVNILSPFICKTTHAI